MMICAYANVAGECRRQAIVSLGFDGLVMAEDIKEIENTLLFRDLCSDYQGVLRWGQRREDYLSRGVVV